MLAQNIAPKPAALPPAAPPALPAQGANAAGGPSFAQFLTEQASPPAPPAETEANAAPDAAAEPDARPAMPASATPARRAAPAPAKPTGPAHPTETQAKVDAKAAAKTEGMESADGRTEAAADDEETPELKEFTQLIGMSTAVAPSLPDAAAATGHRAAPRAKADAATDDSAPARGTARNGPLDATARAADSADTPQSKAAEHQADKRAAGSDLLQAGSTVSVQNAQDAQPGITRAASDTAAPNFAAALAQALPATPAAADITAPTTAQLQAPLRSEAFAPELGARVSLLAVDGVQQAELQLNPAEMGPVAVQIVIDGGQAQVSFHAAQTETRQALEQSLPDLAAALQGQGLTLSGGGVFQQAARDKDHGDEERGGQDGGRGARIGATRGAGTTGGAAQPVRRTVGLLDTFA